MGSTRRGRCFEWTGYRYGRGKSWSLHSPLTQRSSGGSCRGSRLCVANPDLHSRPTHCLHGQVKSPQGKSCLDLPGGSGERRAGFWLATMNSPDQFIGKENRQC